MTEHQRLGPPPIEPLSDAAWARVERGVWSQLDAEAAGRTPAPTLSPSPRRWWLVAAPVLAAAAVAVIVVATRSRPVEIETSRVVTDAASSSVSYGDSHIELDARTALVMSHEAAHPLVLLERGTARFTVAPRLQRPAFIVRAGDATVPGQRRVPRQRGAGRRRPALVVGCADPDRRDGGVTDGRPAGIRRTGDRDGGRRRHHERYRAAARQARRPQAQARRGQRRCSGRRPDRAQGRRRAHRGLRRSRSNRVRSPRHARAQVTGRGAPRLHGARPRHQPLGRTGAVRRGSPRRRSPRSARRDLPRDLSPALPRRRQCRRCTEAAHSPEEPVIAFLQIATAPSATGLEKICQ
ncbi:MAG: FecR domain-containing protein [Deltaproteobacteria bacterium]|nr:MAG: FecR domain-containing protein [Deltaproteobacteria bacterium]